MEKKYERKSNLECKRDLVLQDILTSEIDIATKTLGLKYKVLNQKEIDDGGWEFLTNEGTSAPVDAGFRFNPKTNLFEHQGWDLESRPLPTAEQLVSKYIGKGFKEVFITEAYDRDGVLLENALAVYVKK